MWLRPRMRCWVAALSLALAAGLPPRAFAQADAPSADPEESSAAAEDEADEEDAGDEGATDWSVTHRGLYLGLNGSWSYLTQKSEIEQNAAQAGNVSGDLNSHVEDSFGYGGRLGWRLAEHAAIEADFQMLNDIEINEHLPDGVDRSSKAQFLTAGGNVKGYLLTERLQPYGLVGLAYGYGQIDPDGATKDRSSGLVVRFGGGADFYVSDAIGVMSEIDYVHPTGDISDFDHVAFLFGAFLRFYGGN